VLGSHVGVRFVLACAAMAALPTAMYANSQGVPLPLPRPAMADVAPDAVATGEMKLTRAAIRAMVQVEADRINLPPDIAEAVVKVESSFNPATIGSVGEIGLMQVRPETAAMLGFRGTNAELARPEINIHYGVTYLGKAWRLANGDLCRALMKYRAGHGEEVMTPLSVTYCNRARSHLATIGSPFATDGATAVVLPAPELREPREARVTASLTSTVIAEPQRVYGKYKQGTAAASRAFWAAKEAQVRAIKMRLASKWRRVASR
jgi:hypothetical protein